jgi:uncharacterized protein (TIGR02117 family)
VAAPPLRGLGRALAATAAGIVLAAVLFMLAGWIGSTIPRNAGWREPDQGITIMVETNGTHTGIVIPVVTSVKDWRATFPSAARMTPSGPVTHVAVGWGEREVFLDVATWGDLKAGTVLRILTSGGESVMRVSHYVRPAPSEYHRPLRLTPAQYADLVRRVEASLAPPGPNGMRATFAGTAPEDVYYQARGRYTMVRTCNSWVGDTLGDAGVRIGWWTPFAGGVMKWIEEPDAV